MLFKRILHPFGEAFHWCLGWGDKKYILHKQQPSTHATFGSKPIYVHSGKEQCKDSSVEAALILPCGKLKFCNLTLSLLPHPSVFLNFPFLKVCLTESCFFHCPGPLWKHNYFLQTYIVLLNKVRTRNDGSRYVCLIPSAVLTCKGGGHIKGILGEGSWTLLFLTSIIHIPNMFLSALSHSSLELGSGEMFRWGTPLLLISFNMSLPQFIDLPVSFTQVTCLFSLHGCGPPTSTIPVLPFVIVRWRRQLFP